jgi:hypothetical protein
MDRDATRPYGNFNLYTLVGSPLSQYALLSRHESVLAV